MSDKRKSSIIHRKPNFKFSPDIPKHWLNGSPFRTHLLNSFTLIFPSGERYFIRSVRARLNQITDPKVKEDAMAFIKQEAQHALEHHKFFAVLEKQGYDPEKIHKLIDKIVTTLLEPLNSKDFNLALTAGLEHLTALIAEISLDQDYLKDAPAQMKALYDWHAAEEIEHRSVAFDVYNNVNGDYLMRVIALLYGNLVLTVFSTVITSYLLAKDGELFKLSTLKEALDTLFFKEKLALRASNIFVRYFSPRFHPDKESIDDLAENVFSANNWAIA